MKTIYDLVIGDSYWSKTETAWATLKACKCDIGNEDNYECFKNELKYGKAFMSEEDCQKSIDYDVALAKIKMRAAELGNDKNHIYRDNLGIINGYTISDDYFVGVRVYQTYDNSNKLIFSHYDIAKTILKELPEEVKTVLEMR